MLRIVLISILVGSTAAAPTCTQEACCTDIVTGKCSGNTHTAASDGTTTLIPDGTTTGRAHACGTGKSLIAAAATTTGATDDLCCENTPTPAPSPVLATCGDKNGAATGSDGVTNADCGAGWEANSGATAATCVGTTCDLDLEADKLACCTACDGTTEFALAADACGAITPCGVAGEGGTLSASADLTCTACAAGKYAAASDNECISCDAGKAVEATGSDAAADCADCAAGTESAAGAATCTDITGYCKGNADGDDEGTAADEFACSTGTYVAQNVQTAATAQVIEACTAVPATGSAITSTATTCVLTPANAAATPPVAGSCAVATGAGGSCTYVAPVAAVAAADTTCPEPDPIAKQTSGAAAAAPALAVAALVAALV